jgi:hypothetical protein
VLLAALPSITPSSSQEMARGHFTVRRLERVYGKAVVRTEYERFAKKR